MHKAMDTLNSEAAAAQGRARFNSGPNPDPGIPKIVAPPNACDCHAHIVGPVSRYPFTEDRSYTPAEALREQYVRMLNALRLSRAVIVQPSFYGTDNRCIYDAVAESHGQWRGVAVISPDTPRQEVQRLHDAGFRGVRISLIFKGGLSVDAMEQTANLIAPFGWHLQLVLDGRELAELAPRLRKLPVPIVVDHIGHVPAQFGAQHPGFQALLTLVREGNCWVKLSGPYISSEHPYPYEDVALMARTLVNAGPERIVWGSDWPHTALKGPMPIDATLLDLLGDWVPDIGTRNRILSENPAKLYNF